MKKISFYALLLAALTACSDGRKEVPATFETINEAVAIYPDYADVTIPCNIAPLNVQVKSVGTEFAGSVSNAAGTTIVATAEADKLFFDEAEWKSLLDASKGQSLTVRIYAKRGDAWVAFNAYTLKVAEEPIDEYLSYRLIEPSYELYRQLGLYQRNLTNFEEHAIYENNRAYEEDHNHCVNCHNYQNYNTDTMLFHVRGGHGGTIFVQGDKVVKMNMKADSILSNSVYPSWHPTDPRVVFSSNNTGQVFHLGHANKIEVLDYASDLIHYNVATQEISNILRTKEHLETFPCWAPDGTTIYFCSAYTPQLAVIPDSVRADKIPTLYDSLHYDVMSLRYDAQTGAVSDLRTEVACAEVGKSSAVPRISPDGRYLLFTVGDFGQFHIWHADADLYVKDMLTGAVRRLDRASAPGPDSYHAWSSNGRWLVVASRRDDGSYSRPYIAYFDKDGQDHKAFLLPQRDPEFNLLRMKSYNVPEFSKNAVSITPEQFKEVIYDDAAVQKVSYKNHE